jgi:hypothetical protein
MGIGVGGLRFGDLPKSLIPNPQSPNPQSPIPILSFKNGNIKAFNYIFYIKIRNNLTIIFKINNGN